VQAAGEDERSKRQDQQSGQNSTKRGDQDLLHRHGRDRKRRQQTVLDLLRERELDHERQSGVLKCGEHERQRHHAGQQLRAITAAGGADFGEDATEDEQQEDGLQQRLSEERPQLVADRHP